MLKSAIPALPVRSVAQAVPFYRDLVGFAPVHVDGGFAIVRRDDVSIHLWEANDPDTPGAEPFIAGTASCRIVVSDVDALFGEFLPRGIVHPNGHLRDQWWGERDFTILDPDNNAIAFAERRSPQAG